ncbi:lysophospholipid acyltransferase family protein [Salinispora arenicola]|uniref:1-acyl-sn-glycerol-3-phosphate acyltransferase n=1 Tax=Salinispora arenicola TaxID=168697 RepID=A0A542XGW2_SALAC|nr:lysophospholipid acyltransferase family protein [Salinispora arenicola]MCN0152638.1 1-acyl-sn-glycerol-3-phosphate acyltransferase [Salinispora arenicola]NIL59415.1 1-acyl-sn-glycerol-3-phosphate acyltransferase [Salinispora arenicola]TQL35063.1 1-acyl-sn-glycerol-3-phosphate acyltransferase [Salinispora arenicola]GIM83138.1 1-acyl-sn-glycerol-3-phosphate acyltransferase [Salinispora arenicola]
MARRRIGFWQRFAVVLVKSVMTIWTRRSWRGMEHLPRSGGIIIVPNHISHADPLVAAHFVYDSGRWPQFLGKASLFRIPLVGGILRRCWQIPVERGTSSAVQSLDLLVDTVDGGGAVVIYPEGTTTREPELWPMKGKTGAARLALATGAPVIPVAMWGPERMFDPRTTRLNPRPRIPVTVVAGPPVDLERWAGVPPTKAVLEEMTDVIMLRLRDLLAEVRQTDPPALWEQPGRAGHPGAAT